jgi:hypothetical protein
MVLQPQIRTARWTSTLIQKLWNVTWHGICEVATTGANGKSKALG